MAVGSRRQGNCLSSEKGGGEYEFPMDGDKMEKENEVTAAMDCDILKIFIFPCRTLRRGLAKWRGEGGGAETERVHWFSEGCWTGMCFPKTLRTQRHDLSTIAHLHFSWMRARRVRSSRTGLSGLQQQVDVLTPSSKTTRRTESPAIQVCLELQGH